MNIQRSKVGGFFTRVLNLGSVPPPMALGDESASSIFRHTLPSGLTLVHEEIPGSPAIAYQVWVRAGSAAEKSDEIGVSHFLEHMLFKGTDSWDAVSLNDEVEKMGGQINAHTTYDHTVYHITLPYRFWREGLEILLDLVFHPLLEESEIEIERNVILEELKEWQDAPDAYFGEKFFSIIYPKHGYGRPIVGTKEGVRAVDRSVLAAYYKDKYRPDRMVLSVAGNVEWHAMLEHVGEILGDEKARRGERFTMKATEFPAGLTTAQIQRGLEEEILEIAFPIPNVAHADIAALDLLSYLLGDGDTSRLHRELRIKKQLARAVSASIFCPVGEGRFFVRALPTEGKMLPLLDEILTELHRLKQTEVSAYELTRAKLLLDKEIIFNDETVEGRARSLGYYETVFGTYEAEKHYRNRAFSVTEEQLKDVANRYLTLNQMAVGILIPEAAEKPTDKDLISIMRKERRFRFPRHSRFPGEACVDRKLSNGMRVSFLPTPGKKITSAYAAVRGGLWAEDPGRNGIMSLISSSMLRGTRSRSGEQIGEEAVLLQGEFGCVPGRNSFGLRMDVAHENFFRGIDLLSDLLWNARFSPDTLDAERNVLLKELETQADYFETVASNLFMQTMFPNHPYGMNLLGTSESLRSFQRADVCSFYESVMRPESMVLAVAGNQDADTVFDFLEKRFGNVEVPGVSREVRNQVPDIKGLQEVRRPIQGEKAYLHYGFRGPSISSKDRFAVEVLSAILSSFGGGRLFIRLREELGLVYGVDTFIFQGVDVGHFLIQLNTQPDQVDRAFEEVRSEVKQLREMRISEEELTRVKNFLIGSCQLEMQRNSARATHLCLGTLFGADRTLSEYVGLLSRVSIQDVQEAANRYLTLDRGVFILLSPRVN